MGSTKYNPHGKNGKYQVRIGNANTPHTREWKYAPDD